MFNRVINIQLLSSTKNLGGGTCAHGVNAPQTAATFPG